MQSRCKLISSSSAEKRAGVLLEACVYKNLVFTRRNALILCRNIILFSSSGNKTTQLRLSFSLTACHVYVLVCVTDVIFPRKEIKN